MNYALFNSVRNITRAMGINSFISNQIYKKHQVAIQKEYDEKRPNEAQITANGITIRMAVENFSEYERVMSFKNDEKILATMLYTLGKIDNAVFWDIGTNIGLYSMLLAKSGSNVKRVVCFEPEPRCVGRIKINAVLNGLDNVQIYPMALSDAKGFFNLTVNEAFGVGNHSLMSDTVSEHQTNIKARVEKGDTLIEEYNEPIPNVLKIDVEGAEIKVIDGLSKTLAHDDCKAVLCEVHFTVLQKAGYKNGAALLASKLKALGFTKQEWVDASHLYVSK
jgi:FkbM family methyltransferase